MVSRRRRPELRGPPELVSPVAREHSLSGLRVLLFPHTPLFFFCFPQFYDKSEARKYMRK